jgi:hypothetical protein
MYPPAQGAVLAIGQILGNPWIGILLSVGAMFAALVWMLQSWLPPKWALLGATLAFLQFGIFSYWMNGYWGGSVPAIGGALVMGAFPRIMRKQRTVDAFLLGLGICILTNSRPFEGLMLCIPIVIALAWWLFSKRSPALRITFPRVVAPLTCVLVFSLAFICYYNWRVTQNPLLFPHTVDDNIHQSMSSFVFPALKPPLQYANRQFDGFYNHWERNQYDHTWAAFQRISLKKIVSFQDFFLGTALVVPLLALPWIFFDRRMRFLLWQFLLCLLGMFSVVWFNPHYAAPALATFLCLFTQMFRHMRRWKIESRPVGVGLTRAIVLLLVLSIPPLIYQAAQDHRMFYGLVWGHANWPRADVAAKLESLPGQHLVIVRYSYDHHNVNYEWVYNAADIDHSKIVWAREIPGADITPLLNYYKDRNIWLVEADSFPLKLAPYSGSPQN